MEQVEKRKANLTVKAPSRAFVYTTVDRDAIRPERTKRVAS